MKFFSRFDFRLTHFIVILRECNIFIYLYCGNVRRHRNHSNNFGIVHFMKPISSFSKKRNMLEERTIVGIIDIFASIIVIIILITHHNLNMHQPVQCMVCGSVKNLHSLYVSISYGKVPMCWDTTSCTKFATSPLVFMLCAFVLWLKFAYE